MTATDILIVIAVVVFVVIRRVRRTYVRRKLRLKVILPMLVFFTCVAACITSEPLRQPALLPYIGIGLAAGILMGFVAAGNAELLRDSDGTWHKPHPWLGALILIPFLAFVANRVWVMAHLPATAPRAGWGAGRFKPEQTPLVVVLQTMILTYFLTYGARLLYRWRRLGANEPD